MGPIHVQEGNQRNKGAYIDHKQQQCARACRAGYKYENGADQLEGAREVPEPLTEPDLVKLLTLIGYPLAFMPTAARDISATRLRYAQRAATFPRPPVGRKAMVAHVVVSSVYKGRSTKLAVEDCGGER